MNIVSLTLRDFLRLSFQGIYIYLVIIIVIIHLNWFHFNNRGGNSEGRLRHLPIYRYYLFY